MSGYEAFVLSEPTRQMLRQRFVPVFPDWIGHHVTNRFGVPKEDNRPFGQVYHFSVVGYTLADGVEALVVERGGRTNRPDGGVLHITWSIDRAAGRKPVHSNQAIAERGWVPVNPPVPFTATFEYVGQ